MCMRARTHARRAGSRGVWRVRACPHQPLMRKRFRKKRLAEGSEARAACASVPPVPPPHAHASAAPNPGPVWCAGTWLSSLLLRSASASTTSSRAHAGGDALISARKPGTGAQQAGESTGAQASIAPARPRRTSFTYIIRHSSARRESAPKKSPNRPRRRGGCPLAAHGLPAPRSRTLFYTE